MNASTKSLSQQFVWVGQHPLVFYVGLLALLLLVTGLGWWLLRQSRLMRVQRMPGASPVIGWQLAFGLVLVLAGVGSFVELAGQIAVGSPLSQADQALTQVLHTSVSSQALQVFATVTHLGDTTTLSLLCLVVALLLLTHKQHTLAWAWALAITGNGLLNQLLKSIFSRVRPLTSDDLVLAQGWSFPSGHTSGAVVAYGMLAYLVLRLLPARWHLPALVLAVTLAFSVAVSRVMLQVHFASDVLAGLASGGAWLALCITMLEVLRWWQTATK